MAILQDAVGYGGFVMAHAAWIVSDLENGDVLCPIVVIARGDRREVVPFEAETQAQAVSLGKLSFENLKTSVDAWAFAREGLLSVVGSDQAKTDVLIVPSWVKGLDEPLTLQQQFAPKGKGGFCLVGEIRIAVHGMIPPEAVHAQLLLAAMKGISLHPHGDKWEGWSA